jgi:uncharacterized membrane protein
MLCNTRVKQYLNEMPFVLLSRKVTNKSRILEMDVSKHLFIYLFTVYLKILGVAAAVQCLMLG